MNQTKLTVYFEDPFWVGVFERIEDGRLTVARTVFGAEPKDCDVWEFVLKNFYLLKFSPAVDVRVKPEAKNPKRIKREARKQANSSGIGTKSQQALKVQQEENKRIRKTVSRQEREAEKQRRFEQKQQKKKDKHKGH